MDTFIKIGFEKDFVPVKKYSDDRYIVNFDKEALYKENDDQVCSWKSFSYEARNSKSILNNIYEIINNEIARKIEYGFVWNGYAVHLDKENQINYKSAFDLALVAEESLPVTFRFYKNGKPVLYEFDNVNELKDFVIKMNNHINNCLMEGWTKKDSINESDYKI